ncbi:uncharacterized protein LOC124674469 [Lolium rigidum]|uniref:uncharacterized protein LOC124674469 n=1 Tax=Lolium rigidum TaxID=89674 RepID=UPI001F5CD88B|nr:uncharacterized protein LOC124674469 [Lolium rigidum]
MAKKRAWPRGGSPRIPATTRLCTTGRASASSPPRAYLHLYEQPPRILDRRSVVRPVAAFARKCSRLQDPPVDYNWFSWNLFFGVSGRHMASPSLFYITSWQKDRQGKASISWVNYLYSVKGLLDGFQMPRVA